MLKDIFGKIRNDFGEPSQREWYFDQLSSLFKPSEEVKSQCLILQSNAEYKSKYSFDYFDMVSKLDTEPFSSLSPKEKEDIKSLQNVLKTKFPISKFYEWMTNLLEKMVKYGTKPVEHPRFIEAYKNFEAKKVLPGHALEVKNFLDFMLETHAKKWHDILILIVSVRQKIGYYKDKLTRYVIPENKSAKEIVDGFASRAVDWQFHYISIENNFDEIDEKLNDLYHEQVAWSLLLMMEDNTFINPQIDPDLTSPTAIESEKKTRFGIVIEFLKNQIRRK